jgi:hypothetical protein
MPPTVLADQLRSPSPSRLDALLAEDVRFHSPVADYQGRADVAHLLAMIPLVLDDVVATRTVDDDDATITFLTAVVDGHAVDGVIDEHHDSAGCVVDATLLLRPYAGLRAAIGLMGRHLEADPLPSARA